MHFNCMMYYATINIIYSAKLNVSNKCSPQKSEIHLQLGLIFAV